MSDKPLFSVEDNPMKRISLYEEDEKTYAIAVEFRDSEDEEWELVDEIYMKIDTFQTLIQKHTVYHLYKLLNEQTK